MGIQMTALKACRYGARPVQVGEDFTVTGQSDARLYKALGWADVKETPPAPPAKPVALVAPFNPGRYMPKVMEAELPGATEPTSDVPPKRRYQRRDMTAKTDD